MSEDLNSIQAEEIEVKEIGVANLFTKDVKELVDACGPAVRKKVKEHLVNKEIEERADLVLKGLDKRSSIMRELQKCRPDQKSVYEDGRKEEKYSEAKWKEKRDLEEKLSKINRALEEGLSDKANYDLLRKECSK